MDVRFLIFYVTFGFAGVTKCYIRGNMEEIVSDVFRLLLLQLGWNVEDVFIKLYYMKNTIVLRSLRLLCLLCLVPLWAFAQKVSVQGVVKDAAGESIIGASIIEKGTTNGTITDFDGNFMLQVESNVFCRFPLSDISHKIFLLKERLCLMLF